MRSAIGLIGCEEEVFMADDMTKEEFVKYLRKKNLTFDEFYFVMLKSYFNMTGDERFDLIKKTKVYKNFK